MTATAPVPRALVVYESMFGNTAAVAEDVADGLRAVGYDVRTCEVSTTTPDLSVSADLLVLGAPTHAFSLSRPGTRADAVAKGAPSESASMGMREWLATAQPDPTNPPWLAVFDTRATKVRLLPAAAGPTAARLAQRRGFDLLTKPAAFLVEDMAGPLRDGERARAMQWGRAIGDAARERRSPSRRQPPHAGARNVP